MNEFIEVKGDSIIPETLKIKWAKEMYSYLIGEYCPFVRFLDCKITDTRNEIVVIETDVEVGQHPINDIHKYEKIAIEFKKDESMPDILALRINFPRVPHINLRIEEIPISLCLFDERFDDLKLFWSPALLIRRIREWLHFTAKGILHQENQPLEPLMMPTGFELIIPADLHENMNRIVNIVRTEERPNRGFSLFVKYQNDRKSVKNVCVPLLIMGDPQIHGIIRHTPRNLAELKTFLLTANVDVVEIITKYLSSLIEAGRYKELENMRIILIINFPKKRTIESEIESFDIFAFICDDVIRDLGIKLGVWELNEGKPGVIFSSKVKILDSMLFPLTVIEEFSRENAARYNASLPAKCKIAAIGVGAIGSHIFINLIRAGYGVWTLIDYDYLFPHNLARHALYGSSIGACKAEHLSLLANDTLQDNQVSEYIISDVLHPYENEEKIKKVFKEADIILDMSTSIAVERYVAKDINSLARRVSLFLSPSGEDSVILIEDKDRLIPLDILEMQYYKKIIENKALNNHLSKFNGKIYYANSCRDASSVISQDMVALHSALCSKSLKKLLSSDKSHIKIWSFNNEIESVKSYNFIPSIPRKFNQSGWCIYLDTDLMKKLNTIRMEKLPNETGGILIGSFDLSRKILYIVDSVFSLEDSKEYPFSFIRGCDKLKDKLDEIKKITLDKLYYVGEWHSHPNNNAKPSSDDLKVLQWIKEMMAMDCFPAVMLIVAENNYNIEILGN